MAVHVFLKASFQGSEQFFTLFFRDSCACHSFHAFPNTVIRRSNITGLGANLSHSPISSKVVVERHGLSTSKAPRGAVEAERNTERWGRSCECPKANHKCNRVWECHK